MYVNFLLLHLTNVVAGDKSLPDGWKIRSHQWWCQKRNSHRIHYEFLSPQNEFFKSRKAVVEHMTHDGNYTQDQIEMVRLQTTPAATAAAGGGGGSTGGKKKPATPLRQDNSPTNPLIGWKAGNSTLPPGWKIKRHEYANQTVYFYMAPKGDIIKSRRGVMDYMFEDGGYTEKEFNIVISGAKQRKVALQELYDNRTNKKKRRRGGSRVEPEDPELHELDLADSDDNLGEAEAEDGKRAQQQLKKPKVDKELVQPTRRSGRVASKIKERRKVDSEEEEDDEDAVEAGEGKRKAEEEAGNQGKRIKEEKDWTPEGEEVNADIKSEINAKDHEFKEEEGDEEEGDDKGLLEHSIQYLDTQDSVSLADIMVEDADMHHFKKIEDIEPEGSSLEGVVQKLEAESLVNVSTSRPEQHSAYNVVVNVLTDIVSHISE